MVHEIETEKEFIEKVSEQKGLILVDFYAQWCGPCKRFVPTLNRLSETWTAINFYKVDVDVPEFRNVVEEEEVSAMPTFLLYLDGAEVGRVTGADEVRLVRLLELGSQKCS
jgi:thioredoxin 1